MKSSAISARSFHCPPSSYNHLRRVSACLAWFHFIVFKEQIMQHRVLFFLALAFALVARPASLAAQEKDLAIDGQIKIGVHKLKLESGKLYEIEVKSKDITPNVNLSGAFMPNTVPFGKEPNTFRGVFFPKATQEHTLTVLPGFGNNPPSGVIDYKVTVKAMQLDKEPMLKKEDKLTAEDPKYANPDVFNKTHHKVYPLKMKAGKVYIIDMVAANEVANSLDPYLFVEGANNKILARDDDGGGFPNARIVFRPTEDGEFRIIASALSDRSGNGPYTLTVRTVKESK
jgi:hypothetical protein